MEHCREEPWRQMEVDKNLIHVPTWKISSGCPLSGTMLSDFKCHWSYQLILENTGNQLL
jgi:hypothetical protein